ncbi:MAG: polysaccharide deacetylase family protein, partial [Candidatus Thorarchaeota archaeon]
MAVINMTPLMSVTIDIEDWYHIPSVCGSSFSKYKDTTEFFEKWRGRFDYISGPTSRVIDILAEFGIRATFFIVAEVIERYKGLVQTIIKNGHEIASHGYDHMCYIDSATSNPIETQNL